jgi:hypothetical protein
MLADPVLFESRGAVEKLAASAALVAISSESLVLDHAIAPSSKTLETRGSRSA